METVRFTPTLQTSGQFLELGNGYLQGVCDEAGTWAAVSLGIGTSTVCGTGRWWFANLPLMPGVTTGTGIAVNGKSAWRIAVVLMAGRAELFVDERSVGATHPFAWEADDTLKVVFGLVPNHFHW